MTLRTPGQSLGWLGYVEILRFLQRGPATTLDIERHFGFGEGKTWALLRKLRAVHLVHVCGWSTQPDRRKRLLPMWAPFAGTDAPHPAGIERRPMDRTKSLSSNLIALASIVEALRRPSSAEDVARETGCNAHYLRIQLRAMRKVGFVRIADWRPRIDGSPPTALWALGRAADAPRPAPIPARVINSRNWNRHRARQKHLALVQAMAGPISQEFEHA